MAARRPPSTDSTLHIYTRVSTAIQRDEGTSLQTQLEQGKHKAKQLGFTAVHWDEGGKSSHHEELAARPKLAALYQAIRNGEVKHLFVYDQSRLSRNDHVASVFRYECNKQGVTLYTKDGKFDLANPQDKFLKQILDGLSEFDNSMRAERTRLGKLNRTRAGGWHGGPPPYGYRLENKRLTVEPTEAKWVQRIFAEAHEGRSPAKIRTVLEAGRVEPRRGGQWTLGSIAALLRNPHYTGSYTFKDAKSDEQVQVRCPAIVDADVWNAVQIKRKRKFSRILQKNATTRWFYLVRDIMYCGHCGRPIAGRQRPSKRERFYYCPNKERQWVRESTSKPWKRGTGCGMDRSLNLTATEELVYAVVRQTHQSSVVLHQELKQRLLAATTDQTVRSRKEVKALESRIQVLEKQIGSVQVLMGSLEGKYEVGDLPKKAYEARSRVIREKLESLEIEANNARLLLKGNQTQRGWAEWCESFGEVASNDKPLTDEQKRDYIEGLVERIDVRYDKAANEHQLMLRFKLPVLRETVRGRSRESLGAALMRRGRDLPLRIEKRAGKSEGKAFAPWH